ncbi:hypothetical protein Q4566_09045 [Tamlana sp. 2_MG-2023]|uniref:hypothetical protein n=1 Tax=unclassified Tamlana TaxID=2614803 RepID=UPI0026E20E7A|nr:MULTISPECIES: hypothetical protein [unclassified Tamlana]MDO6760341.1 hypothetical protein [Tamlana sp. 2_MG-2023]MDO6789961.1 hypothetical protein [Tamlana sp. 1_MG-2023]
MKLTTPYTFILLVLMLCCHQMVFCLPITQEPEELRHFDADFKTRYSDSRFNYEGKAVVRSIKQGSGDYNAYQKGEKGNELGDKTPEEENNQDNLNINLGPIGWFFYLAIALAVIFLVYMIFKEGGTRLFTSKRNKSINTNEDITAENIENADIKSLINHAEKDANYRLAIRYYYLLVLKTLSINNLIKFEDDKTNSEYLSELHNTAFGKDFGYISYLYNYIWYGEFPVDIETYDKAKSNFETFLKQVKS